MPDAGSVPTGPGARCVDPTTIPQWDALVGSLGGSVFHTVAWARVLRRAYGFLPCYQVRFDDTGRLIAVLPLMEIRSWLTGRRGVSLPFTDVCEGLGDPRSREQLHQAAAALGIERRWKYLECRSEAPLTAGAQASVRFHRHQLDLTPAVAELFRRLDPSCQRAIRKAQRAGVTIEEANDLGAMQAFYGLLCRTRKRHGQPPQPWNFFAHLHHEIVFQKRACVMLARRGDAVIAGAVYLHSGTSVLYKYGASDDRHQAVRGNNLVMWEAVRRHAERGFTVLDLGRTSIGQEGLRRFKLSWGAKESLVQYTKYDFGQRRFTADVDRSSGWHTPLFRHLPTVVSRAAGALLYRHAA